MSTPLNIIEADIVSDLSMELEVESRPPHAATGPPSIRYDCEILSSWEMTCGRLRAGFIEQANLRVTEHVSIKAGDMDGNVTQLYDSGKP